MNQSETNVGRDYNSSAGTALMIGTVRPKELNQGWTLNSHKYHQSRMDVVLYNFWSRSMGITVIVLHMLTSCLSRWLAVACKIDILGYWSETLRNCFKFQNKRCWITLRLAPVGPLDLLGLELTVTEAHDSGYAELLTFFASILIPFWPICTGSCPNHE